MRLASAKALSRPHLFDGVTSLYALLSTVHLISAYVGPLLRIRNPYDESLKDFYPYKNTRTVNPADVLDFTGGRTPYVNQVYDQTGNSRHGAPLTSPTQSHIGMSEPVLDFSGEFPSLFFGAQAPGQMMGLASTLDFGQNLPQISAAAVFRSIYNISAGNKNIVAVCNNAAATRLQLSVGFATNQFSGGGRRLDGDSFKTITGPQYDTLWHVHMGRHDCGAARGYHHVDDVMAVDLSFQTAGNMSNTASGQTVTWGAAVSRQGGFIGGSTTLLALLTSAGPEVASLIPRMRRLIPGGGFNHTLTVLFNQPQAQGGQGFCGDQTNFWIGHSLGDATPGTIYKTTYAGAAVANFSAIVSHAQSVFLRGDTGNLCVGDYDTTGVNAPKLQEMNKTTGAAVRNWQFTGVGHAKAPTMCYHSAGKILLITHPDTTFTGAPRVSLVTISDDGTFSVGQEWDFRVPYGQVQGCVFQNGSLYVIVDDCVADASHANGTIYKFALDAGSRFARVVTTFPQMRAQGGEQEGLTYDGVNWYQITNSDGTNCVVNALAGMT